jgi:hypothetical protein
MSNGWSLNGNSIRPGNFLGTTNNRVLSVRTNGTERMRVGVNGNIGIGVSNPARRVHVSGDRIRLESEGKRIEIRADGNAVDVQSNTHNLFLHSSGSGGRNHVIMNPFGNEGNVGIGTQSPTEKLHVSGRVLANDVVLVSDARLKSNVRTVVGAKDGLARIRGVEFDWVGDENSASDTTARRGAGVIAQEIEDVFPELVNSGDDADYKSVNFGGLSAILIEAIKEIANENRQLRARLEAVEANLENSSPHENGKSCGDDER